MSDVDNPLTGEHGATAIFGPQKGVTPEQVATIDAALAHFADQLEPAMGIVKRDEPGAGAAGGLGFALHMLGARFETGAEVVAREIGLDAALEGADWLITGEGRSDDADAARQGAVHRLQARAGRRRAGDAFVGRGGFGGAAASVGVFQRMLFARARPDHARCRDSRCRALAGERSGAVDAIEVWSEVKGRCLQMASANKNPFQKQRGLFGARSGTRTRTPLLASGPKPGASTNFAILAARLRAGFRFAAQPWLRGACARRCFAVFDTGPVCRARDSNAFVW